MSATPSPAGTTEPAPSGAAVGRQTDAIVADTGFTYPAVDPGFPVLDRDTLLSAHAGLLRRIKVAYGTDRATFESDVLTVIERYAAFVHLLPATASNYFSVPGGLLQLGLETAFYALQGTDGHIFSGRATITIRRQLEPRWRLATFIAGLCAEIHRTLSHIIVTDHAGKEWQPYLGGLLPWLQQQGISRYYLKWVPNAPENPGAALFALPHIVPASTLQNLAGGNSVIVPHMMASMAALPLVRENNILAQLVRRAAALVIDRHLQASADRYGKPQLGSHLERYLVDAMRRLVSTDPAWQPNAERSRVWYGADGLFIAWPNGATDLRKLLEADQLPGIPKSPETMREILLGAGVFEGRPDGTSLWKIAPPPGKTPLEAVKLATPALILVGLDPMPAALPHPLAGDIGDTPSSPPGTPTVPAAAGDALPSSPAPAPAVPAAPKPASNVNAPRPSTIPSTGPQAQQLDLLAAHEPPSMSSAPDAADSCSTAQPASTPARTPIVLDLPLRLASTVKAALADIVTTLNASAASGSASAAAAVPDGLFVALTEFEHRHVEPALALRALHELHMLALADGATSTALTSNHEIDGHQHVGLVLQARFVSGLPLPPHQPVRS